MDDRSIIALLKNRDEQAIEQLKQRYGSACRHIAYTILKNREDAEEVLSDKTVHSGVHGCLKTNFIVYSIAVTEVSVDTSNQYTTNMETLTLLLWSADNITKAGIIVISIQKKQ